MSTWREYARELVKKRDDRQQTDEQTDKRINRVG